MQDYFGTVGTNEHVQGDGRVGRRTTTLGRRLFPRGWGGRRLLWTSITTRETRTGGRTTNTSKGLGCSGGEIFLMWVPHFEKSVAIWGVWDFCCRTTQWQWFWSGSIVMSSCEVIDRTSSAKWWWLGLPVVDAPAAFRDQKKQSTS